MTGVYTALGVILLAFAAFLIWVSRERPLTTADVDQLRKEAEAYAQTEEFARFYEEIKAVADKPSPTS